MSQLKKKEIESIVYFLYLISFKTRGISHEKFFQRFFLSFIVDSPLFTTCFNHIPRDTALLILFFSRYNGFRVDSFNWCTVVVVFRLLRGGSFLTSRWCTDVASWFSGNRLCDRFRLVIVSLL